MRPLKTFGRGIIKVVNWLDAKGGFVTAIATVFIAVLTGVYVHYSRAQWKVMRDQLPLLKQSADAAKTAADTATRELEFSQRPWITVKVRFAGPFTLDRYGASTRIHFRLDNIGHS